MLFDSKYEKLNSEFDFNKEPKDNWTLNYLDEVIYKNTQEIYEIISEEKSIVLNHKDNLGKQITIKKSDVKLKREQEGRKPHYVWHRSEKEIIDLLVNDNRLTSEKTTISKYLLEIFNIQQPEESEKSYKYYLQLLYFFYMTRYVVFYNKIESDNMFDFLSEDKLSSESLPNKRAENGKYLSFIFDNLMDNKILAEKLRSIDKLIVNRVHCINFMVNELINWRIDLNIAEKRVKVISALIDKMNISKNNTDNTFLISDYSINENLCEEIGSYIYRFMMLSDSKDMINNLKSEDFQIKIHFKELEYEFPRNFEIQIDLGNGMEFDELDRKIADEIFIKFCKQKEKLTSKDKNYFKDSNAVSFVKQAIAYDIENIVETGGIFVRKNNGRFSIGLKEVAAIIKTYNELNGYKVKIKYKNSSWNNFRSMKGMLSVSKNDNSKLPSMLVMNLFLVACHSQFYNIDRGYGYYYPFKTIDLNKYILKQEIVQTIFQERNPENWLKTSNLILEEIKKIYSQILH